MPGRPLPPLSEAVYESLLQMILSGRLEPRQPVSELELSRTLGVSRTPIHEAVAQLAKDGLIVREPNIPVVRPPAYSSLRWTW